MIRIECGELRLVSMDVKDLLIVSLGSQRMDDQSVQEIHGRVVLYVSYHLLNVRLMSIGLKLVSPQIISSVSVCRLF